MKSFILNLITYTSTGDIKRYLRSLSEESINIWKESIVELENTSQKYQTIIDELGFQNNYFLKYYSEERDINISLDLDFDSTIDEVKKHSTKIPQKVLQFKIFWLKNEKNSTTYYFKDGKYVKEEDILIYEHA